MEIERLRSTRSLLVVTSCVTGRNINRVKMIDRAARIIRTFEISITLIHLIYKICGIHDMK